MSLFKFFQVIPILSFYCCHPSEFPMASKDNTDTFSNHIMNAIAEIKNSKKMHR